MHSSLAVCLIYFSIITVCLSENTTETALLDSTGSNFTLPPYLVGKHKSLYTCPSFDYDPDEYELLPNRSAHIKAYNLTLNETFYILRNKTLTFCLPFKTEDIVKEEETTELSAYLTIIGIGISMISLFLHLVVFCLVPDLRNLPGWNLAALCASLFISYLLLFLISSDNISDQKDVCVGIASVTHFFLLASFLWMSIMSCDVFLSVKRATSNFRASSTQFNIRKFGGYCLIAFGIALLFAIFGALADKLDIVPEEYRPKFQKLCWFDQKFPLVIFFAGPVIIMSCLNFLFFGCSAYVIHSNKRKTDQEAQNAVLKRRFFMYFRLSAIMGVTWIVGIAANIANMDWVWYVFVVLNALQGFFIFLAFTFSKKVKKYFRQKLSTVRRSSQQTLTPSFQSYCFYANSIEKDLDKIVDSNKGKIDTIMINL